jgi:hypothetical protein
MPDAVVELLVTEAAIDKLGARGITTHDARQVPRNAHVIVRNPHKASPANADC